MSRPGILRAAGGFLIGFAVAAIASSAAADGRAEVKAIVDAAFEPVMRAHGVPGMTVGVVTAERIDVFNYGVASRKTRRPVDDATLFELGSVSKTFAATLAAYAETTGRLSLSDSVTKHLPALRGSALDRVTLADLGTHTSGGMPLQVPAGVRTRDELTAYLRNWKPVREPGTLRTYSNVSIGLFGMAVAASFGGDFRPPIEDRLLPALGLDHTHLAVPRSSETDYAQGYTRKNEPTRLAPGPLATEAYGLKSTAGDLARFVALNMGLRRADPDWEKALQRTHTGFQRVGPMTQDLVWEQYAWPAKLDDLLAGNASRMALEPGEVEPIEPPSAPRAAVFINKTGSTSGFSTYVAFVPEEKLGVVMLANRNFPNEDRVRAAYRVLQALGRRAAGD